MDAVEFARRYWAELGTIPFGAYGAARAFGTGDLYSASMGVVLVILAAAFLRHQHDIATHE